MAKTADQLNWEDIDGERASALASIRDPWLPSSTDPATYYRGIMTQRWRSPTTTYRADND